MAPDNGAGVVVGGWVCLGLAIVLMVVSLSAYPVYGALFFAACASGAVAVRRKRLGQGVALIVLSMLAPGFAFVSNIGHNRWSDGFSWPTSMSTPSLPKPVSAPPVIAAPAPVAEAQSVREAEPSVEAERSDVDR